VPKMTVAQVAAGAASGDVLLWVGRGPFARAIQLWTRPGRFLLWLLGLRGRPAFSHLSLMEFAILGGRKRAVVIESLAGPGVRVNPFAEYVTAELRRGCRVYWYRVIDPGIDERAVVESAFDEWAKPYARIWQMALAFGRASGCLRKLLHRALKVDPGRWWCSQLGGKAFQDGKATGVDPDRSSPEDAAAWPFLAEAAEIVLGAPG
jgi:hypothetical protein